MGFALSKFLYQFKDKKVAKNKLEFLNSYESPALDENNFEQQSLMGPYGGYSSMFLCGSEIRSRYNHLWDESNDSILPLFTASQERIVVTSVNVARGFLGSNWKKHAKFIVLNETEDMGLNSLTPVLGCPKFDAQYKGNYTVKYGEVGLDNLLKRLKKDIDDSVNVTTEDLANLMALCMYDLNVVGHSKLCDYFTPNDWKAFEYKRDLDYYYYSGKGNPIVPAIGGVVTNSSLNILTQDDNEKSKIYISFAHETNILMYLTSVGLFNPEIDLDWKAIEFNNRWTTSQIVPMGTRVALERISCKDKNGFISKYVRFLVNNAVIPHNSCKSGPGFSCPIDEYIEIQRSLIPDIHETCGINDDYRLPKALTFYWDWKENPEKYKNWVVDLDDF